MEGKVNGIECSIIPDTGAEVTIVPGNLVPNCLLIKEWEIIQGVTREPVKAQCAIVNMEVEGKYFMRRVVVATNDLLSDEVFFPVPLSHNDAKQLLPSNCCWVRP